MTLLLAAVAATLVGQPAFNDVFPLMADWPPPEAAPAESRHGSNDALLPLGVQSSCAARFSEHHEEEGTCGIRAPPQIGSFVPVNEAPSEHRSDSCVRFPSALTGGCVSGTLTATGRAPCARPSGLTLKGGALLRKILALTGLHACDLVVGAGGAWRLPRHLGHPRESERSLRTSSHRLRRVAGDRRPRRHRPDRDHRVRSRDTNLHRNGDELPSQRGRARRHDRRNPGDRIGDHLHRRNTPIRARARSIEDYSDWRRNWHLRRRILRRERERGLRAVSCRIEWSRVVDLRAVDHRVCIRPEVLLRRVAEARGRLRGRDAAQMHKRRAPVAEIVRAERLNAAVQALAIAVLRRSPVAPVKHAPWRCGRRAPAALPRARTAPAVVSLTCLTRSSKPFPLVRLERKAHTGFEPVPPP